jgi:aspartyl-tRNA(Asn)/glutamyl-tRNA(Gln) amidotransferase subunit B
MNTTNQSYQLVCGLEIHAELKTASKMFCACKNDPFHAPQPNIYTCPVCLGMPGGLPVANKKAIEWTIMLGLSLNCKINLFSKFDRKNYFYPDLPKGYQISQYDIPFCYDGYIETSQGRIGIRRIHLEEDTGKLIHKEIDGEKVSLIDFNRSGVPLVEIVTEPDIISAAQAKEYGKKIRQQLRYLNIADCDMEQGGMRLEANISLRTSASNELPNYKVEVKNINSFRFLEQAIEYEMDRHAELLDSGTTPHQETRGWNPDKASTFPQRTKEDAEDYRYFPDPDLPPIRLTKETIDTITAQLPEPLSEVAERWTTTYGIKTEDVKVVFSTIEDITLIDTIVTQAEEHQVAPAKLISALINKKISLANDAVTTIKAFKQATATVAVDLEQLTTVIRQVITDNPDEYQRYQQGETKLLNFFIGQVMRAMKQKLDMQVVQKLVTELLAA